MKKYFFIPAICLLFLISCKPDQPDPEEPLKIFMLALVHIPSQLPWDFTADEISGDYKPSTGLLRVEGKMLGTNDKIELRIKNVGDTIIRTFTIGEFSDGSTNTRAEFIDGTHTWDAKSLSGTFEITGFERLENVEGWLLSGKFTFTAASGNGNFDITNGEISNAYIIEGN